MPRTQVRSDDIGDSEVRRQDLNITTPSEAVIRKVIAGSNVSISSTGADEGTGDVTINFSPGSSSGNACYRLSYLFGENYTTYNYLHVGSAEYAGYTISKNGTVKSMSYWQTRSSSKNYELRVNGTTVATLSGTATTGYDDSLNIDVVAGDVIKIYVADRADDDDVVIVEIEYPIDLEALRGPKGDDGADGYSGFDFITGNGAPGNSVGEDGDVYLDNITGDFYKKESGTWVNKSNFKGPQGDTAPYVMLTNDVMTNINSSTSGTKISGFKTTELFNSKPSLFSSANDGVTVSEEGVYKVYGSLYQTSSSARTNVAIQVTVNCVNTGRYGAQGYIRSASGHNESSASILDIVYANAGDKIGLKAYRLAASGTVTAPEETLSFIVEKIG